MAISAHTALFGVLGHPVRHSLSPLMHNVAFSALGMDAAYLAFDVGPGRLAALLPALAELGFAGLNLTLPLKEAAFRALSELDDEARLLGSVNTVKVTPGGGLEGHSTDGRGFLRSFEECFGAPVAGRSVFLLGCGGAGRAVAIACARAGAGAVRLANRDQERACALEEEMREKCPGVSVETVPAGSWAASCRECDAVVHAASVGIRPGEPALLDSGAFRPGQALYDLVYMFPETPVMAAARRAGARAANGLGMLLHQGALAFRIWTGVEPPIPLMRSALETAVYGKPLVGAEANPGSGDARAPVSEASIPSSKTGTGNAINPT